MYLVFFWVNFSFLSLSKGLISSPQPIHSEFGVSNYINISIICRVLLLINFLSSDLFILSKSFVVDFVYFWQLCLCNIVFQVYFIATLEDHRLVFGPKAFDLVCKATVDNSIIRGEFTSYDVNTARSKLPLVVAELHQICISNSKPFIVNIYKNNLYLYDSKLLK